jgi:TrmH family RNA methyltransferase
MLVLGVLSAVCTPHLLRPTLQGTLLRTALALGWDGAYLLPGCADPFNDKSLRASRGAVFKLPLATGQLQGWRSVAAAHSLASLAAEPHRARPGFGSSGQSASRHAGAQPQVAGDARVGLVLGSEGQGLSEEVLRHCVPVAIPMPGEMESLNVAAAGAILMFALSSGAPQLMGELAAAAAPPAAAGAVNGRR